MIDPTLTIQPIVMCELTVYDPALPGTRVLYIADREFRTGSGDTPASTLYRNVLKNPGTLVIDLIAAWTKGLAAFGIGEVSVVNTSGAFDSWKNYTFDGWPISIYLATVTAAGALTKQLIFSGKMENPDIGKRLIRVPIRSAMYGLDKPVLTVTFAGTGSLEGDDNVRGKLKPRIYGHVRNVPLILVDPVNLIYFVSEGVVPLTPPIAPYIGLVYDAGLPLTFNNNFITLASVLAAVMAPGQYGIYYSYDQPTLCTYIKLKSLPLGQITVDEAGYATAGISDLTTVITAILTDSGITPTGINRDIYYPVTTPASFGSAISGFYGRYIDDGASYSTVLAELLAAVAGWMWLNPLGPWWELQNLPLFDNQGDPVVVISDSDILDMKKLGNPKTPGEGIPPWSIEYLYDRNELVQTSGLAATTTAAWRNFVGSQYRSRTRQDASVKTRYPLAQAIRQEGRGMMLSSPDTPSADFLDGYWGALQLGHDYYYLEVKLTPKLLQQYSLNLGVPWVPASMPSIRNGRIGVKTARFGFTNSGNGTEVSPVNVSLDLAQKKVTYIVRTTYQVG